MQRDRRMYRGEPELKRRVWKFWAEGCRAKDISRELDVSLGAVYKWVAQLKCFGPQELAAYYPGGSIPDIVFDKWKSFHPSTEWDEFVNLSPPSIEKYRFSNWPGSVSI